MTKPKGKIRVILLIIFLLYCLFMLRLLLGRTRIDTDQPYWERIKANYNLVPFKLIQQYIRILKNVPTINPFSYAFTNFYGNIILFIPFGFFLPLLWKKQRVWIWFLLTTATIIITIELSQLFLLVGICDIDDLILNLSGSMIGFLLWKTIAILNLFSKK